MKKCVFFGLLLLVLAAACRTSEPQVNDSEVRFNVGITPYQGQSQQTARLDDGSKIAIQVEDISSPGEWGETKLYVSENDLLSSEDPFVITEGQGDMIIRAWNVGENMSGFPSEWTVKSDQSADEESLTTDDFLYGVSTMGYGADGDIVFYPQTARISVNVLSNEYLNDFSQISSLKLGNGDMALSGTYTEPVSGINYGTWIAGEGNSDISPLRLATPSPDCVATYRAVIIPQNMEGKNLIILTLANGVSMSFVPASDDLAANIEAGHEYVCDVAVNGEDMALIVTVSEGGAWTDGGSTDIDSDPLTYKEYDPQDTEPKIGDYFYSDGSWSDGGLRRIYYEDGAMVWDDVKPEPLLTNPDTQKPRSVIGLVFTTDTERMGEAEKQALEAMGSEPHGLVISTFAVGSGNKFAWSYSTVDETEIGIRNTSDFVSCDTDIDGYYYNQQIRNVRRDDFEFGMYPAFSEAADFASEAGGPEEGAGTTGWYMPSVGQWFDVLRNLAGINVDDDDESYMSMSQTEFIWTSVADVPEALNNAMINVPAGSKVLYTSDYVLTSSGVSQTQSRALFLDSFGFLQCSMVSKTASAGTIRCVLAF